MAEDARCSSELIDAGQVKLYSVDSVNGRVLLAGEGDSLRHAYIQRQFFELIRHEVVPAMVPRPRGSTSSP